MASTPPKTTTIADPPGRSPFMKQEMQQLHQRGLTKSLTKHFTEKIATVEAELAAAESAFTELEARKAKASEFAPNSPEIQQLDMLCTKVAEWKRQCRLNEQEAVMLYARYCEKFGNSIELVKPEDLVKSSKDHQSTIGASTVSVLANTDVGTLVKAFREAETKEPLGIPPFLRPSEVPSESSSSYNSKELEEILEDSSLPDDAPCRALAATPTKADVTSDLDDDDSSIVSGLTTLNSYQTREVLHDAENKVLDFIKNETENIRKMMEEDAQSKAEPSVAVSQSASHVESVAEHENMVERMKKVLDDFKKAEEESNNKEEEKGTLVRRIEAGNEGEQWYEHFDDVYQRHYYVEKVSGRTQWNMPHTTAMDSSVCLSVSTNSGGTLPARSPTPPLPAEMVQEFSPGSGRRSKRVELYRAKVRRQRNRRLVSMAVVFAVLGAGALYYKLTNPEKVDKALETVASVIGSDSSSKVEVKSKESASKKKKANTNAKKEAKTPSSTTPSVPVPPKLVKPATTTKEVPLSAPKKTEPVEPAKKETDTTVTKKEEPAPVIPDENYGLATFAPESQHWILDVLIGPLAFKDVNRKCLDPNRYCGLHHH